mgnify:CR=1 FL=1
MTNILNRIGSKALSIVMRKSEFKSFSKQNEKVKTHRPNESTIIDHSWKCPHCPEEFTERQCNLTDNWKQATVCCSCGCEMEVYQNSDFSCRVVNRAK